MHEFILHFLSFWSNLKTYVFQQGLYTDLRYTEFYKVIYYKQCSSLIPEAVDKSSSCIPYNNIVHNWHINTYLVNNGWTKCYDENFAITSGTTELLNACPTGDNYYIFMGAMPSYFATFAYIGAYGPSHVISDYTSSITLATIPFNQQGTSYDVYWYNYYEQAIGFSPTKDVLLTENFGGDDYDKLSGSTRNNRLSFSLHDDWDGYRAGVYTDLINNYEWRKVVYYKECPTSFTPQPLDGNCYMNSIVHEWHLKSNLLDQGWQRCYFAPYSEATRSVSNKGCPNGMYYQLIRMKRVNIVWI